MVTARTYLTQRQRLIAVVAYILIVFVFCRLVTTEWFPADSGKRIWLLSAVGLWFFALIGSPWFRPPKDSIVNSVSAFLLLATIDLSGIAALQAPLNLFRWIAAGLCFVAIVAASTAIVTGDINTPTNPITAIASKISYRLSDTLGRGEVTFTPPALISIVGYYQPQPVEQLWLLFGWVLLVAIRPLELSFGLFAQIQAILDSKIDTSCVGKICRIDSPNIVRIALTSPAKWQPRSVYAACLPSGDLFEVIALFSHIQESQNVGTGLLYQPLAEKWPNVAPCYVYQNRDASDGARIIRALSGQEAGADLIGFVVEDSEIGAIKFEVSPAAHITEGSLIFCRCGDATVFFQVLNARTTEEVIEANPRGKHVASAAQLGLLDPQKGFVKYGWLPEMNAPVFMSTAPIGASTPLAADEMEIGKIPGSAIGVRVHYPTFVEYHSAILGITGTGKTEIALDAIRFALKSGDKVFCVDFTGEYGKRLKSNVPQFLSVDDKTSRDLETKLAQVEIAGAKGDKERQALREFLHAVKPDIVKKIGAFLGGEGPALGIFELPEIVSTKATLRATELYLSAIMDWARANRRSRRILIVLEEAHTIIPETGGAGFDFDTQYVIGRIAQIALQGRKYGVGLLVVSQRTALVSKSVLSQCNTYITLSLVDKTSLEYLANVYSPEHVRSIPNLRFLEALVFGKSVRSERPVLVRIPEDAGKKAASAALDKKPESPLMAATDQALAIEIAQLEEKLTTRSTRMADD